MNVVASLRSWMRGTFRRSGVEQQMDDELRFHIESCTDDLVRAGLAPEEARRRACREFGGVEVQKEECRDALGLRLLDELVADGRYACRQLRRSPGFTAVAVLSLALGIGATSAIFSLMEAAVWKPIAVPEPERLGLFSWVSGPRSLMNSSWGNWFRTTTGGRASTSFSYPIVDALKRQQQVFGTVFAFKPLGRVTAVIDGEAELVQAQLVSGDFYSGLGVAPIAGALGGGIVYEALGPRVMFLASTVVVAAAGLIAVIALPARKRDLVEQRPVAAMEAASPVIP